MPLTARAYLLDRFRTDALALRQRADTLAATTQGGAGRSKSGHGAAPVPGPDAETSRRMAAACDSVVQMLEAIPEADDSARGLASIVSLLPLLEHRAAQEIGGAPVRAVYAGAATRIREVEAAEAQAQLAPHAGDEHDLDDDDDVDDDDLHEDATR